MLKLNHRILGNGPPMVMLHGLFGSMENLGGIARLLTDHFELHMLDLRNHGRSPHHPQMTYACMAEDVHHYMESAGIERAHVLGHSMGGKTAMQLALTYPERMDHVIVADIAPVQYPPHHNGILKGLSLIDPSTLQSRQHADDLLKPYVAEVPIRQFLLKNLVKQGAGGFQWRMNLEVINSQYQQIMAGQHSTQPFTGPLLFIKGGKSDYIQPQHREHTAKLFPNAAVKIIPNTGHWLHAEKPELFTRVVKRFLQVED